MNVTTLSITKPCSKCKAEKPATLEFFAKLPTMKLGLASWCRACANAYIKAKRLRLAGPKPTLEERFWAKVDKSGPVPTHSPELGPCHVWTAALEPAGYGVFWNKGKIDAHRMSWILHNGAIPDGRWVLHRCDNPCCVNVAHLFIGTVQDNVDDCIAKRRHQFGERHRNAKLTESDVRRIRALRARGLSLQKIAKHFPVSWEVVRAIVHRRTWKEVT